MSRRVAEVIRVKGSHTEYYNYRDCVDQDESQKSVPMSVKDRAHGCIQSLGGVRVTNSEGLWPQLICCAPHLSTVPLISDKVQ